MSLLPLKYPLFLISIAKIQRNSETTKFFMLIDVKALCFSFILMKEYSTYL